MKCKKKLTGIAETEKPEYTVTLNNRLIRNCKQFQLHKEEDVMNKYTADFTNGKTGSLPEGWVLNDFGSRQAPKFLLKKDDQGPFLSLSGNGDPLAVAYISTKIKLAPGVYSYEAGFSFTPDVNPQKNLLFQCWGNTRDGIFKFSRVNEGMAKGKDTVVISGEKEETELRVYFRFNSQGEVKLRSLELIPAEAQKPRWARFACTSGRMNRDQMRLVADKAAADGADLLLYPEIVSQKSGDTSDGDLLLDLLSELAAKHRFYTSASVYFHDKQDGRNYNRGVLYDRGGKLAGTYDKIHPYSPEVTDLNITPGNKTSLFKTDFGKVGMIICYDSWFTDVTQLLALKGAEVILFPVAGYYKSLIPARAADNSVRFVISVLGSPYGIYDTAGRDVTNPDQDETVRTSGNTFKDVRTFDVDGIAMLCASLDLNCTISPHFNGGKMAEAPGGKRNRADQVLYLDDMIKAEKERWWELE